MPQHRIVDAVPWRIEVAAVVAGLRLRSVACVLIERLRALARQGGEVVNSQKCVQCKPCDIKHPTQKTVLITHEGGGGPNYAGM